MHPFRKSLMAGTVGNLSVMTVLRVINGNPHVEAGKRERVMAAIVLLKYEVNRAARAARTGTAGPGRLRLRRHADRHRGLARTDHHSPADRRYGVRGSGDGDRRDPQAPRGAAAACAAQPASLHTGQARIDWWASLSCRRQMASRREPCRAAPCQVAVNALAQALLAVSQRH